MVLTEVSRIIHSWLGWCPNLGMIPANKAIPFQDTKYCIPPAPGIYADDNVIIDCGRTAISPVYFFGLLAGVIASIAAFVLIIKSGYLPGARILTLCLIIPVVIVIVYRDLKKAVFTVTSDTLVIRRPFHRTIQVPKDSMSSVEIRPNEPAFPLRYQKISIAILAILYAGIILEQYYQLAAGEIIAASFFTSLGADLGIVVFILALYYHARIRAGYAEVLIISTNTQKRIVVYGKNLPEIKNAIGRSL